MQRTEAGEHGVSSTGIVEATSLKTASTCFPLSVQPSMLMHTAQQHDANTMQRVLLCFQLPAITHHTPAVARLEQALTQKGKSGPATTKRHVLVALEILDDAQKFGKVVFAQLIFDRLQVLHRILHRLRLPALVIIDPYSTLHPSAEFPAATNRAVIACFRTARFAIAFPFWPPRPWP